LKAEALIAIFIFLVSVPVPLYKIPALIVFPTPFEVNVTDVAVISDFPSVITPTASSPRSKVPRFVISVPSLAYIATPPSPTDIVPRFEIVAFSPYIPIAAFEAVESPTVIIPAAVFVIAVSAFVPKALLLSA